MTIQPNVFYNLTNRNSGLVLGIAGGSTSDDAQVVQWLQDGSDNQVFFLAQLGAAYLLVPNTTLMLLSISAGSTAPGAGVIQWRPNGSPNQRFLVNQVGGGYVRLVSPPTGLVLGIGSGSTEKGAQLVQSPPDGSDGQLFSMVEAGYFRTFRNKHSGLVLGIAGGSTKAGANVVQWPSDGSDNQQFLLLAGDGGYFTMVPKSSLKVLGIRGGSTKPGTDLVQWHPDGSANQAFLLRDAGGGDVNIVSEPSGLVVGIASGSTEPGAAAVQWNSTGAADQQFWLNPVSVTIAPLTAADLTADGARILKAMEMVCPEVRFHPYEKYFPYDIPQFVNYSQVRGSDDHIAANHPTPADLEAFGQWGDRPQHDQKEAYYISPPLDWSDPILVGSLPAGRTPSHKYEGGYDGGTVSAPMVVRGYQVNGTYWFDYVFFYPYNGEQVLHFDYYTTSDLLNPFADPSVRHATLDPLATHIGDWEHAQIQLSGDLSRIIAMRVFGHGDPTVLVNRPNDKQWAQLKFEGSHPILYAGLHSHATYHTPGHHTQPVLEIAKAIASAANDNALVQLIMKALGAAAEAIVTEIEHEGRVFVQDPVTCDWCDDGGATWQGWNHLVPFGVEGSGPALPGFTGMEWPDFYPHRWGRSRTFSNTSPLNVAALGAGVSDFATMQITLGIRGAQKAQVEQVVDGAGVSPPDWWRSGY